MAASSRAQVLRLYRALLRESQRFSGYNYRTYAIRRIRDAFRENKSIKDSEKIEELVNKAKENLEIIHRQHKSCKEQGELLAILLFYRSSSTLSETKAPDFSYGFHHVPVLKLFLGVGYQFCPPHPAAYLTLGLAPSTTPLQKGDSCRLALKCVLAGSCDDGVGSFLSDLVSLTRMFVSAGAGYGGENAGRDTSVAFD
ncbi:UNVERIFIED_CONTAM: hypothetical protein H355_008052 [Colinus virginianus]|nr:hypothetical protein H355_008052 [Colinus virginianus]